MKHVACGDYHSLFLTEGGAAYAAGRNQEGQLGVGDATLHYSSKPLLIMQEDQVRHVAAGGTHSACLLTSGSLLTWGKGALGQPDQIVSYRPVQPEFEF